MLFARSSASAGSKPLGALCTTSGELLHRPAKKPTIPQRRPIAKAGVQIRTVVAQLKSGQLGQGGQLGPRTLCPNRLPISSAATASAGAVTDHDMRRPEQEGSVNACYRLEKEGRAATHLFLQDMKLSAKHNKALCLFWVPFTEKAF